MKIAFLTCCLEPTRDGVGDYTRILAEECERRGHGIRLVALNDAHLAGVMREGHLLRLGSGQPWKQRVEIAREFLEEFGPDFVSLQFVCYGFHPRGIDWQLAGRLEKITRRFPVQIMFHELWIGAEKDAALKNQFIGSLQRRSVLDVVHQLDVRAVHTSNPAYVALLKSRDVQATRLPLFGSIPIREANPDHPEHWLFGLFGTLHPVWPPEPLFSYLRESGKKIVIAHIGHLGSGEALWEKITRDYAGVFEFRRLGEQPTDRVSEFFSKLDFGIATSPWELVGKSSTVAAMLEHGLPVIVNRDEVHYEGWQDAEYSPLLIKVEETLHAKLAAMRREPGQRILPQIAGQFLDDLQRELQEKRALAP